MRIFFVVLFVVMCMAGVSSCSSGQEKKINVVFPNNVWNRFQPMEGMFTISNVRKQYDVKVELSVLNGFEYNYIPIEIVITSPSGQTNILNKTLITKNNEGKYIGNVYGDVWTIEQTIYANKEFTEEGEYSVYIQNRTQYYDLYRVKSLSFSVVAAKNK